jgi:hypothetical protein
MPDINISQNGILKLLLKLKENKASGPDNISPKILRLAANPIAACLKAIFTASLASGTVPEDWRLANITPVFKKGERFKAANYRPVSLTCICSKLLEHIIVSNLMDHFDNHEILDDCQHGFRSQRSCETQLLNLTHELHEELEKKSQIDTIVLDFSKAFDKVPHARLMAKLHNYGVQGKTHDWIKHFLMSRKQRVIVDGEASDWAPVASGVPQGTVLGPVLFLAFINDLPNTVTSKMKLFADDCIVYNPIHSINDCNALQSDLHSLEKWEEKWCMSFNASKCNAIQITRKHNKISFPYTLHNTELENVKSTTYLGVELSSDLTWSRHIGNMVKKANKQLGFVKRNLPFVNEKFKEIAYFALVRPKLEYCSPVWDTHLKKYKNQIEMVQRRAARYVLKRYNNTSSVSNMLQYLK